MNAPAKPRSTLVFWIAIAVLGFVLLLSVALNTGLFMALVAAGGQKMKHHGAKAVDEYPVLTEVWSYGQGDAKVARIPVTGIIMRGGEETLFGMTEDPIESILQQIRAAKQDEEVRAIIVEVDSPGGGVTASDEIYAALMDFKQSREGRIVTVFIRDLAASGGYYVAVAGDWLMAEPTSVIGSIGVIMQTINMKGLGEKIGVRDVTIKSGRNKDLLNPFVDVPPEQMVLLQGLIDNMYQRFVGLVQDARPIEAEKLKELADGRIFPASQALDHKLIDGIGYWDNIVAKTAELLGEEAIRVIRYEGQEDFLAWLTRVRLPVSPSAWLRPAPPRLQYLWQP